MNIPEPFLDSCFSILDPRVLIFPYQNITTFGRRELSFKEYQVKTVNLPLSRTVYRLSGKKEQLQLNVFRGSLLRWFLGVVYRVEVVMEGGSVFSLHLHFTLTLLLAVSRMYSNVVNGYITSKIWSPDTFQDNLNRYTQI